MFPAIDRLNDEQRAAATFEGDQLRILAGAGTGKTTALTARVAWLVAGGMPERSDDPARPFNTSLLFEPDGRLDPTPIKVTHGTYVFVAIDEDGKPRQVPKATA